MPSLTLLIIYYSQSPEDNGENLETWVGSSPICSSKASNNIKKQGTLSGAPTKKKTLTHGHFSSQNASKNFTGWVFSHLNVCRGWNGNEE